MLNRLAFQYTVGVSIFQCYRSEIMNLMAQNIIYFVWSRFTTSFPIKLHKILMTSSAVRIFFRLSKNTTKPSFSFSFSFFYNQVSLTKQNCMILWSHEFILYVSYLFAKTYDIISQNEVPNMAAEGWLDSFDVKVTPGSWNFNEAPIINFPCNPVLSKRKTEFISGLTFFYLNLLWGLFYLCLVGFVVYLVADIYCLIFDFRVRKSKLSKNSKYMPCYHLLGNRLLEHPVSLGLSDKAACASSW